MGQSICRWGIFGAADIARKNWQAIRNAPNCMLTAVAARDPERCRRFVTACQGHAPCEPPPSVCDTYEALLAREDVDAVYLPLPTGVRKEWAVRAAQAGKHVLVEKPAGVDADEVREILEACRSNGVQFMDGVMFMHSRRLDAMRQVLDDGQSVGEVKRIASQFTFGAGGVLPGQYPHRQPAGAARLPGRPGLVQPPLHAMGDGRAVAPCRMWSHAVRAQATGQSGPGRHGLFGRAVLSRRRVGQFLLFISRRDPAVGEHQRDPRRSLRLRLRAPLLRK